MTRFLDINFAFQQLGSIDNTMSNKNPYNVMGFDLEGGGCGEEKERSFIPEQHSRLQDLRHPRLLRYYTSPVRYILYQADARQLLPYWRIQITVIL